MDADEIIVKMKCPLSWWTVLTNQQWSLQLHGANEMYETRSHKEIQKRNKSRWLWAEQMIRYKLEDDKRPTREVVHRQRCDSGWANWKLRLTTGHILGALLPPRGLCPREQINHDFDDCLAHTQTIFIVCLFAERTRWKLNHKYFVRPRLFCLFLLDFF